MQSNQRPLAGSLSLPQNLRVQSWYDEPCLVIELPPLCYQVCTKLCMIRVGATTDQGVGAETREVQYTDSQENSCLQGQLPVTQGKTPSQGRL